MVFRDVLPLTYCLKVQMLANGEASEASLAEQIFNFEQSFNLL
jgi:hypothetical protein